ncbi:adenosine deaminase [Sporolactobacillus sp. THM7-7]|nr:adenosine deaminase [Sporolactobacillus sp. THM7-7]
MELLEKIPKVDLHFHLDGSVRPETIKQIAQEEGLAIPDLPNDALIRYMQVDRNCNNLQDYLSKFDFVLNYMQSARALEQTAYDAIEQVSAHNCQYLEVRFAPQLHRKNGLSVHDVVSHVLKGLNRGEKQFGVVTRAILICLRGHTHKENMEVVEAAADFLGKGVVAVDLAGDEAGYPPERYRDIFQAAQKKNIPITIHAGEAGGPENIDEAIHHLGAVRIGHGVRLREDPQLLNTIKENGIPLEMCPISNIQTKAVKGWDDYPIRQYFDQGVHVTVNTDNITVSNTNITKEYAKLIKHYRFSIPEIVKLISFGLNAAFLEKKEKGELKATFNRELQQLGLQPKV